MTLQDDLLAEIMRALPNLGIAETTFGRLAVNDGKFVRRLRAGENITVGTITRVRAFLAKHPDGRTGPRSGGATPARSPEAA